MLVVTEWFQQQNDLQQNSKVAEQLNRNNYSPQAQWKLLNNLRDYVPRII